MLVHEFKQIEVFVDRETVQVQVQSQSSTAGQNPSCVSTPPISELLPLIYPRNDLSASASATRPPS